ncbi:MAG: CHAT domain-containing protein [Saprospiraceae bacterium]|nr:CHAT domain-containing protein [Saprospiraceae bacterium]
MRQLRYLSFLFSLFSVSAFGQSYTLVDTTYSNSLLSEASNFIKKRFYDSALTKLDSAQIIIESIYGAKNIGIINILCRKSDLLSTQRLFDKAIIAIDKAKDIQKNMSQKYSSVDGVIHQSLGYFNFKKGEYPKALDNYKKSISLKILEIDSNSIEMTDLYDNIGDLYSRLGDFNKAIEYQEKSLNIKLKNNNSLNNNIAQTLCDLGFSYYDKAVYSEALKHWQKIIETDTNVIIIDPLIVAKVYGGMAEYYSNIGEYDKAIENDKRALYIDSNNNFISQQNIANDLNNIATSYAKKGDYYKSFDYHWRALDIRLKVLPPLHPDIATSYNNLANYYNQIGDYDKAVEYLHKSLNIKIQIFEKDNIKLAYAYNGLASAYRNKKNYDKALSYNFKALDIKLKKLGYFNHEIIISYGNIAICLIEKKEYKAALEYLEKALEISNKVLSTNHPSRAQILSISANCYFDKGEYDKGIKYAEEAITGLVKKERKAITTKNIAIARLRNGEYNKVDSLIHQALLMLGFEGNQKIFEMENTNEIIKILKFKAYFKFRLYIETKDTLYLNHSINIYKNLFSMIMYQEGNLRYENSKLEFQETIQPIYEGLLDVNLTLSKSQNNNSYLIDAFTYSEYSKAQLLRNNIRELNALKIVKIPNNLLQKEYNLRIDINWREKQRQEKLNEGKIETDSSILAISSKLFDLRLQYDSLKQYFEQTYPDYYRLKYDNSTISLDEVQKKLLSTDQTLLSYFVGDSSIFAFLIRKDTFAVFDIKKDFLLDAWVQQLRTGLYGYQTAKVKTEALYEATADSFALASTLIHDKIIAPLSHLLTKEVIIVPDGVLGYVPFDVLLTEKPLDPTRFNSHKYLGKTHIISYNYSATLWREMRDKKHKTDPKKPFIGFAPYYDGDTTLLSTLFAHDPTMRKDLNPLRYSGEEVYKAQKLMRGESVMSKQATKTLFEKIVGDYRIVHLATHGNANDKVGDYSFLAFAEQRDSQQNELLYVRDIYNLSLNADMVVLSACETGIGELKRGEGIVSLARAFTYAGAKSMVTTLWDVNDKSTMYVMEGFYRQLRKGQPKDKALWQSKIDYFTRAKGELAHPYFWAAFIPIGDMRALKN